MTKNRSANLAGPKIFYHLKTLAAQLLLQLDGIEKARAHSTQQPVRPMP